MKKLISIVTPCFNEAENIEELCFRIKNIMTGLDYDYEHIVIDNHSSDNTFDLLKEICLLDKKVKVIRNARNFGHMKSPFYALLQTSGEATILITSDLQEPPEMIPAFLEQWELGYKVVMGVKRQVEGSFFFNGIRNLYYSFLSFISEVDLIKNSQGIGLFDRKFIDILRNINEPYPYLRGLVSEIGLPISQVVYDQSSRKRGITSNNFYTLYDLAMTGIVNHSKLPLRVITMLGFMMGLFGVLLGLLFFILKLLFWNSFQLGMAPILIGIFFFGGLNMFIVGFLAEYIFSIHNRARNLPLVVELERINF